MGSREKERWRTEATGNTRVVDDHVVSDNACCLVILRDPPERVEEKAITELHDIGLVYTCDFLIYRRTAISHEGGDDERGPHAFLSFLRAKSKANLEMRSALARVMTFMLSTTPG